MPITRHLGSLTPTKGPFLAHDPELCQAERRQKEPFVSGDVFLLQLGNNEHGISGASTRHKTELNIVDVHHRAKIVPHIIKQPHGLICEVETRIIATVKGFIVANILVQNEALLPVYSDYTMAENSLCQLFCKLNSLSAASYNRDNPTLLPLVKTMPIIFT